MERIGVFSNTRPGLRTREAFDASSPWVPRPWTSSEVQWSASFLSGHDSSPLTESLPLPWTGRPTLAPTDATGRKRSALRVHVQIKSTPSSLPVPLSVEVPIAVLDPALRRALGRSVLETRSGLHLFLTLPDRSNGFLTPADRSLRSFTTVPLELSSPRLLRYRAREVLRSVVGAHRLAQHELDHLRSTLVEGNEDWVEEALFSRPDLPETALFNGPVAGEIWRNLQGTFPHASRLAFTGELPGLVRRWWQVGDTRLLRATSQGFRPELVDGMLRGLRARFAQRRGSLVAFEGLEHLQQLLPLSELERLVQGVRESAEAEQGHAWISWSPGWVGPEAERVLGRGFAPITAARRAPWTLEGVGEDARLVPYVPGGASTWTPSERAAGTHLAVPTLGEWLATAAQDLTSEGCAPVPA